MAFLLHHWLDRAAASVPDKAAFVDSDGTITTYREFRNQAIGIAARLRAAAIMRGDRVVVVQKRSSSVVVSMFGALYADAVYVPVHAGSPVPRFKEILDVSTPAAIVCDAATRRLVEDALADSPNPPSVLVVGEEQSGLTDNDDRSPVANAGSAAIDTDPACLIFTSGTTGQPKGVAVSHRSIIDYMDWAEAFFEVSDEDRVLATAPFHFDMSTFDVHIAVRACATLCIASDTDLLFPGKLLAFMARERPTVWKAVSSLLAYLAKTGEISPKNVSSLSRIAFAGEKLPTRYLIEWMNAWPNARYFNAYGPTEATGVSLCHEIVDVPSSAAETMPIGLPCSNTDALILDADGRELGSGETGELCIRGTCLAIGYWNDPVLTRARFIEPDGAHGVARRVYRTGDKGFRDAEGVFHLVGRVDDQVKVQGYRIELGEVTHALETCASVLAACTLCIEVDNVASLIAFVETGHSEVTEREVIRDAKKRLAAYMMPSRFVIMENLPRTDRGKIDTGALRQSLQAPQDELAATS
jgi:amino acid adenylation domain-containing protein